MPSKSISLDEPDWALPLNRAELIAMANNLRGEVHLLKALLRTYAPIRSKAVSTIQCPGCEYYGLYAHAEVCELAPYLTL